MKLSDIVYTLLKRFTVKNRNHIVNFDEFVKFFLYYKEQDNTGQFDPFDPDPSNAIKAQLILLEEKGSCTLNYVNEKIHSLCFGDYFKEKLLAKYNEVELSPEEPFPDEKNCGFELPPKMAESVNIKEDFIPLLKRNDLANIHYVRLRFPGNIKDVLIPGSILRDRLPLLSLQRIGVYLSLKNNATYLWRKLNTVLNQPEQTIFNALKNLRESPGKMLEDLKEPSGVSFPFWAQVSNFIIKDLLNKNEKQSLDHTFCQAAFIIGYLNIHARDLIHERNERADALNSVGSRIKKPPYAYSLQDILTFKERETLLLDNKYSKPELFEYLEEKASPSEQETLGEIILLRLSSKEERYIHREAILFLCYKGVSDAHASYRRQIVDDWGNKLASFKTIRSMKEDEIFRRDLGGSLKKDNPLLYSLLNYNLLFLAINQNPKATLVEEVRRFLDVKKKTLLPIDEILKLNRKDLLEEAMRTLPFWRNIPIISGLIAAWRNAWKKFLASWRDYTKKTKTPARPLSQNEFNNNINKKRGARNAPDQKTVYRQKINRLMETFVEEGKNLDMSLQELAEAWNPLYDPKAKANLVEDVNSLTRDYLKNLRRGFLISPPDAERIRNMACLLGENKGFARIKDQDLLIRYLELYIIKCLR